MYSAERVIELINSVPWLPARRVRAIWLKLDSMSRKEFAPSISVVDSDHSIIPFIIGPNCFQNSNALLADLARTIENNRESLSKVDHNTKLITLVLLSKDDLTIPQVSSPIVFPEWFPILAGKEDVIYLHDLGKSAQVSLLNSSHVKVEQISDLIYEIEWKLVSRIKENGESSELKSLISKIHSEGKNCQNVVDQFDRHVSGISSPSSYRLSARNSESLLSALISTFLKSSPDEIVGIAKKLSLAFNAQSQANIKPTLMAVMFRPSQRQDLIVQNFHSLLIGIYQAYQLMNAAAHAAEYPPYPVDLVESHSRDLVRFLSEILLYLQSENEFLDQIKPGES